MSDKEKSTKEKLIKLFSDFLDGAVPKSVDSTIPLIKQFDDELMQATEVVYEPDVLDAHDQYMSKATVELLCERLNKAFFEEKNGELNLFHMQSLEKSKAEVVEIFLQKGDAYIGEHLVKDGTCIATVQYHDKQLWEMRKANIIGGLSVQGKCRVKKPEENNGDS